MTIPMIADTTAVTTLFDPSGLPATVGVVGVDDTVDAD